MGLTSKKGAKPGPGSLPRARLGKRPEAALGIGNARWGWADKWWGDSPVWASRHGAGRRLKKVNKNDSIDKAPTLCREAQVHGWGAGVIAKGTRPRKNVQGLMGEPQTQQACPDGWEGIRPEAGLLSLVPPPQPGPPPRPPPPRPP